MVTKVVLRSNQRVSLNLRTGFPGNLKVAIPMPKRTIDSMGGLKRDLGLRWVVSSGELQHDNDTSKQLFPEQRPLMRWLHLS